MISPEQRSCYILLVVRLKKNGTPPLSDMSSQDLSSLKKKKEKNGEMFHVSCLFLPKAKRRAKESWDRYSDIPREDVAGMKACHFVTDDHETAPLFFFFFFESDFVRI